MMTGPVNPVTIFVPVLLVVALTLVAFLKMAVARGRAAKEGANAPGFYRAFLGGAEPEYAVVAVRHYGNLFELPTLFYAGCILAFVLDSVTLWALIWAWSYVIARAIQSTVHLTYNNPAHRGLAFVFGWVCIGGLWILLAIHVFERL